MGLPAGPAIRKFRDLWRGGMPLTRAAQHAGLTVGEAEAFLDATAVDPPLESPTPDELRTLFIEEGLTAAQIAEQVGLTVRQVRRRLEKAGIRRPPRSDAGEVVRLYREGHSTRAVAALLGVHQSTVWRQLKTSGTPLRPVGTELTVLSRPALEQLHVRDGMALEEIAERFQVTPHVVARNLDRYGIPRRRPPLDRAVLDELYVHQRLGISAVAGRLEVSETRIRADLAHHGIPIRRPGRPGSPS